MILPKTKLGRTNLNVPKIALGTVELGYTYGIGPRQLPTDDEAITLLRRAVEMGINFFDTAHFYGVAEERIAKSGIAKKPGVIIATKCGHDIEKKKDITKTELETTIRREIDESRKRLGLDMIDVAMVHGGSAEQIESGMIVETMQELKNEGKIKFCGISTRGEEAPRAAIESNFFDVIQIGYNIFDQRQNKINLSRAKMKNVGVIARSVFLKGALTPLHSYLPNELSLLKEHYKKIEQIAKSIDNDVPTLALRFAFSNKLISTVLIGTQSIRHLEKASDALNQESLPQEIINELKQEAIDDPNYVDPSYWPATAHSDDKTKIVRHFDAK